ncbi:three-Cys-motif partner protein TcmP [Flavobacterium sp. HXWNR29]|uniref:three-Cys-motif partner protein TcmP n=1 Tax=Flavobacterium odoriferum TaxID=2946604 RepID=UPI0021CB67BF|nr:three-Cys-motif partner protein TcmP [Flavobacterium sp. HXWNR29]MCU4189800.1 three-Cys-motif partner protein TcmP [Flavobacterium sp. HXWNR29]
MAKNHFNTPFDDGTKAKLEIFRNYLKEWLPVFISNYEKTHWDNIFIYDFFAGEGKDVNGTLGSSLIILDVLNEFSDLVSTTRVKINVIYNEKDEKTFNILSNHINEFNYNKEKVAIKLFNLSFQDFFKEIYPKMIKNSKLPRLMILDQFGIKEITTEIFKKLISFERTDFIFFISSSFVRRFNELPEFKSYLSITKENFEDTKPFHSHKVVFEYYKSMVDTNYMLAPFSIKKGINIYGLIFGSNHTLGIEKFLKVGWKINPHTGDANYNIDEEKIIEGQPSLFEEDNTIKKLGLLDSEIRSQILSDKETSLYKVYLKTLEFGCLPKHCNEVLRKLEKENKILPVKTKTEKIHNLAPPKDFKITIK